MQQREAEAGAYLVREIVKVLRTPEIAQQLTTLGMEPIGSTSWQYAESIRANYEKYGKMVKISGARADD